MPTRSHQGSGAESASQCDRVVMLYCAASSAKQWRGLAARLGGAFHPISVNLCGHGNRDAWHGDGPLTLVREGKAIESAIGDHQAPFHLIGHSYGGGVALRFALDHAKHLRSLVLIEPSCFHILKEAGDEAQLLEEIRAVAHTVSREIIGGDLYRAMEVFIDYWSGSGTLAAFSQIKQNHFANLAVHVVHHVRGLINSDMPLRAYAAITVPTLILCGTASPKPSRAITHLLADALPQAKHRTIRNAGHMSPITHPDQLNPLILDHLQRNRGARSDWRPPPGGRAA